jgi:hypothetical protein
MNFETFEKLSLMPYLNPNPNDSGSYYVCLDDVSIIMREDKIGKKNGKQQDILNEDFGRQYPEKKRLNDIWLHQIDFYYPNQCIDSAFVWIHCCNGLSFVLPVKTPYDVLS